MEQSSGPPAYLIVLVPLAFMVVFPLFWCAVVKLVSVLGPWSKLAQAFPGEGKSTEDWWYFRSGRLGGFGNYNSTLHVGLSAEGLHLDVPLIFRAGHRPVLIPWDQLEVGPDESFLFFTYTPVVVPSLAGLKIRIQGIDGEVLRAARRDCLGAAGGVSPPA